MMITIGSTEILTSGGYWYVAHNSTGEVGVWPAEDEVDAREEGYTEAARIEYGFCAAVAFPGDETFSAWIGPFESESEAVDELGLAYPEVAKAVTEWRCANEQE